MDRMLHCPEAKLFGSWAEVNLRIINAVKERSLDSSEIGGRTDNPEFSPRQPYASAALKR